MNPGLICLLAATAYFLPSDQPATVVPISIKLRPQAAPVPALRLRLLPDVAGPISVNAAPLYLRAALMATAVDREMSEEQIKQLRSWQSVPLEQLPRKEVREQLDRYKKSLEEIARAARRERCEWDLAAEDGQDLVSMPLNEMPVLRNLAHLLAVQARLEMSEGKSEQALETMRTGFGIARHLGAGPFLIHALIGNVYAMTISEQVRDWIQLAGSANLYWALTAMPAQFLDTRKATGSLHFENSFLYRMFPLLREVDGPPLSARQAQELQEILQKVAGWDDGNTKEETENRRQALRAASAKLTPEARRFLIKQGRTPAQVDALPTSQAVAIYSLHRYHELSDDLMKWAYIPYFQAVKSIKPAEEQSKDASKRLDGAPFISAVAAYGKVALHMARTERAIVALRCVEAIRMYAATHGGKFPASLSDLTQVPVPLDPITGKPFEYKADGNKATLFGRLPELSSDETHVLHHQLSLAN